MLSTAWNQGIVIVAVIGIVQLLLFSTRGIYHRATGQKKRQLLEMPKGWSPGALLVFNIFFLLFISPMACVIVFSAIAVFIGAGIFVWQHIAPVLLGIAQNPIAAWFLTGGGVVVLLAGTAAVMKWWDRFEDRLHAQLAVLWITWLATFILVTPLGCRLSGKSVYCSPETAVQWAKVVHSFSVATVSITAFVLIVSIVGFYLFDFISWKRHQYSGAFGFRHLEAHSKVGTRVRLNADCRLGGRGQTGTVSGVTLEKWFGGSELEITWDHGLTCPESISKKTYYAIFDEM